MPVRGGPCDGSYATSFLLSMAERSRVRMRAARSRLPRRRRAWAEHLIGGEGEDGVAVAAREPAERVSEEGLPDLVTEQAKTRRTSGIGLFCKPSRKAPSSCL